MSRKIEITREEAVQEMKSLQKRLCREDPEQIDFLIEVFVNQLTNEQIRDELNVANESRRITIA